MVVFSLPKTTALFQWTLSLRKLKERFLWGYPEFKGGNQVGDEADRDVRRMGRSAGSSGKPTKATDMVRLGEGFRICSSRWQSHREYRCEFSSQLLTTGGADANESTLRAFEVEEDSWLLPESHFSSQCSIFHHLKV